MLQRAVMDGAGRLTGRTYFELVRDGALGIDLGAISPELRGRTVREFLPARQLARLHVRHTVGLLDPITAADFAAPVADGLPERRLRLVRKLSMTETTTSIAFYSNVTAVVLTGIAFHPTFVAPAALDLALMATSGLIGGTALLVLIAAYRRSPAALVAPFQYSQMLWAILLGALVWADLPEPAMLLGASMVTGSGLFILYRETALGRRPTASLHNAAAPKATPRAA